MCILNIAKAYGMETCLQIFTRMLGLPGIETTAQRKLLCWFCFASWVK